MVIYRSRYGIASGMFDALFEPVVVISELEEERGESWENFARTRISFYTGGDSIESFHRCNYYMKFDEFLPRNYLSPADDSLIIPMITTNEGDDKWLDDVTMPLLRQGRFIAAGLWLAIDPNGTTCTCIVELFKQQGLDFDTPQALFPVPARRFANGRFNDEERQIIKELFLLRDEVFQ